MFRDFKGRCICGQLVFLLRMVFLKFICLTILFFCLVFSSCCGDGGGDALRVIKRTPADSLAFELCKIYGADQGIRDMKLITRRETSAVALSPYLDSINFFKILDFTKKHGVPRESLLGTDNFSYECVKLAYFAVLLHTPHMLVNNQENLDVFIGEVRNGNMSVDALTTVLDKYYVIRRDEWGNRRLLYGSQFGKPCRMYRKQSDSVRAIIGLKPLHDSLFVDCNRKPL